MPKRAAEHFIVSASPLAHLCKQLSLVLAACLVFLVPFDPVRNIDLQGLLLLVSGGFAWGALLLGYRSVFKSLDRWSGGLLIIFAVCCVMSLLVNSHFGYDLLGAPYVRLGTGGLLACLGIGLLARTVSIRQLVTGLYVLLVGLAVVSVPYSFWHFHSLLRIGGLFAQADTMACFVGCGLLIGVTMLALYPFYRKFLLCIQGFLVVVLLLTQTRAVLLLIIILGLIGIWQTQSNRFLKSIIYSMIVLLLLGGSHYLLPNRLTNTTYASRSVQYRLTLQHAALQASARRPLWGYGPGNLADALACPKLPAGPLQTTCQQGYFFDSSHNIFIDQLLGIGWLGGLSYLLLMMLALYRGVRSKQVAWASYTLGLIAGYYLTNVTSLTLELLLWILLLQCLLRPARPQAS
jgi:O-antigen ligase